MSRARFGLAAGLYALLIVYASTIVGVSGPRYVPLAWSDALHRVIAMRFVEHGSDQRADWIGNLLMLVPLGFLVAGLCAPARHGSGRTISGSAASGALLLCFGLILAVKYLQLFFPPRTVTWNYVAAQSIGALVGIVLFGVTRASLGELRANLDGLRSLRVVLRIYTALLIVYMLMPLDFALSLSDLSVQFDRLPDSFTALSGAGRPLAARLTLSLASVTATAPIGALLSLTGRERIYVGRSVAAAAGLGGLLMFGVYAASLLVISAAPSLPAIAPRTGGIALGTWLMHRLSRHDPDQSRERLGALVNWVVPLYLLTVLAVNGLLSVDEPLSATAPDDPPGLGLLPLYNYYIVSKAQAAKNVVGHVVMYAPIGVLVWLRARHGKVNAIAFVLAACLSAIVEVGRYLHPGLQPDINAVPLAGLSAWAAAVLTPMFWRMFAAVAKPRTAAAQVQGDSETTALAWRDRARHGARHLPAPRPDLTGTATGDIEHY